MAIHFYSELPKFSLSDTRRTSNWLTRIARGEGFKIDTLAYIFCSDAYLRDLNEEYLGKSYLTDILSFDYSTDAALSGEIYISIERVKENAADYKQPFSTELRRVMAHGLLHFIGYKDKTARQKALMRKKEDACLSLWK